MNLLQEIFKLPDNYLFYRSIPNQEENISEVIRCKVLKQPGENALTLDPLGALVYNKTGKVYNVNEWQYAASELDIPQSEALGLVKSSDNSGYGHWYELQNLLPRYEI